MSKKTRPFERILLYIEIVKESFPLFNGNPTGGVEKNTIMCLYKKVMRKNNLIFSLLITALIGSLFAIHTSHAAAPEETIPEVQITREGLVKIKGLEIQQRANTTFFARTSWDKSLIRWVIKTDKNTDIRKRFGDKKDITEIKEGDYISIEGSIEGGTSLSVLATKVIDWSDFTSQGSFSGTVGNITTPEKQFTLIKKDGGTIEISINATTTVYRNRREVLPKFIRTGDRVDSITGTYTSNNNQLLAQQITISIDPTIFSWKNYEGTLKTIPSTTKPVTFQVVVGGKEYTVVLYDDALVLNTRRQKVTFERFLAGDTVRIWGHIRADNDELNTINGDVLRNMAF
ncbi:MAG: hypothetical protein A2664_03055 [Candidatus Taylorbacteria bacterium RIFCSPHIGHO2_01_FULL_46_22b]|uniref:Uncharacterized protein n=1 Tax=Candidatus Taylorbacteria bacterium RIFCSPHIGHO2_01_FULL_46_22b TaxID=1802301 RepID=A0A1G2M6B0_9BACT|nr:MAG: hypothetical protein A2664_03055 [Candidatus Taylorbacteria bacterium RIFCSPHIGHO2_01_FULL_46_22b]